MPERQQSHPSLSIVIPAFNEEDNLGPLFEGIFDVLRDDPDFCELVVVDDGSSDRTAALTLEAARGEPRIRLVKHDRNRGLGASIRTGLSAARGEAVLYTDADLAFDFTLIPRLLSLLDDNNVVVGRRANRGEGFRRLVLTKGYNTLCRFLFGLRVGDVNFACKLIPRRALGGMKLESEGSFIDAEILLECSRQGFTISEFPLEYYPRTRGRSTLSRGAVIVGILIEMARYIVRSRRTAFGLVEEINHKRG